MPRVVQWATGPVGRHAMAAVVEHPDLELVGALVYGDEKNDQGRVGTAMHAVHAIAPVCAAPPGIRTFLAPANIAGRHVLRAPAKMGP